LFRLPPVNTFLIKFFGKWIFTFAIKKGLKHFFINFYFKAKWTSTVIIQRSEQSIHSLLLLFPTEIFQELSGQ
ncbi:hypothetical protein CN900_29105, partial [Bacillus anthracis]